MHLHVQNHSHEKTDRHIGPNISIQTDIYREKYIGEVEIYRDYIYTYTQRARVLCRYHPSYWYNVHFSMSCNTRCEHCNTEHDYWRQAMPLTSSAVQKDACACLYIFQISGYWIGKMTNRRELFLRSGSSLDFASFSLVSEDNRFEN